MNAPRLWDLHNGGSPVLVRAKVYNALVFQLSKMNKDLRALFFPQLAIAFLSGKHGICKGISQDGVRAYFAKQNRASPFTNRMKLLLV
jgi:hypothetical protein